MREFLVDPVKGRYYVVNTLRCFEPFSNQEDADKILDEWDDVCNKLNVPHFLIHGTCLGFYRDGGYIENDGDIDLAVICSGPKYKEMAAALCDLGWYGRVVENLTNSQGEQVRFRREIMVCIPRLGEGPPPWAISYYAGKGEGQQNTGPFVFESFDVVTHHGREFNVAHPVEDYLVWVYGEGWRTRRLRSWR